MGFIPPLIAAGLASVGGAGAAAGTGAAAGIAAGGATAGASTVLGGLAAATSAAAGLGTLATMLGGKPKAPGVGTPPTPPSFSPNIGGNRSLAAQAPGLALGGTNLGVFASAPSGGKTLLGQ